MEILLDAMKHGATGYVAEYTVSSVTVPMRMQKAELLVREAGILGLLKKRRGLRLKLTKRTI